MREAYQSDLRHLVDDLTDMATMAHEAIQGATRALLESDLALAERVIAGDPHLDERQLELDAKIIELLARQSPVATDLRLLVSALRMSSSLERMGDLAAHIALIARRRHPVVAVPEQVRPVFVRMAELAAEAIVEAREVIAERDLTLAAKVETDDDEIDSLLQDLIREVGRETGFTTDEIVDITLLGRFYERFGDHAVSLVRRIGFLVTGDSIDTLHEAVEVADEI